MDQETLPEFKKKICKKIAKLTQVISELYVQKEQTDIIINDVIES